MATVIVVTRTWDRLHGSYSFWIGIAVQNFVQWKEINRGLRTTSTQELWRSK